MPGRIFAASFVAAAGSAAIGLGALVAKTTELAETAAVAQPSQSSLETIETAGNIIDIAPYGIGGGLVGMAISGMVIGERAARRVEDEMPAAAQQTL
ncbi:MAG TPA: hypothetical protein VK978_04635 [Candidatus Saccharimonadales bacterium]|nr:hypothetical protein [Candidatus Saccharimonadales bacterium]